MQSCDLLKMLSNSYEDPSFFVDYYNLGRGLTNDNKQGARIISTKLILVWKIVKNDLIPVEYVGVFYDSQTYLIQWTFTFITESGCLKEETVFFYWTGSKATKGLSPLPEDFDNDTAVVNRIVQWSEPPVFFHIFPKPVFVLNENFNPNLNHLFIVLGELPNELHVYELPFLKKNLRSRGVFLIVTPSTNKIYIWKGSKLCQKFNFIVDNANLGSNLQEFEKTWKNFDILGINEQEENNLFIGDIGEYWHVKEECNYSPKLFYLNSITGEFMATEVEYPLRSRNQIAPFPFLKSHLNSADPPGLFLLDNNYKIWFIHKTVYETSECCKDLYNMGLEITKKYSKLKEEMLGKPVPIEIVESNTDQIEFTNIFPYWN